MTYQDDEAKRRYDNAESDRNRILAMKSEMADILGYACSQACYQRGITLSERQCEELTRLIQRFL